MFKVNKKINMKFADIEEWIIPEGNVYQVVDVSTGKVLWKSPAHVTVTFDAQGGTCYEYTRYVRSGKKIGDLPTATKENYAFVGWFTQTSGGTQINSSYVVTSNITIYAQYVLEETIAVFDVIDSILGTKLTSFTILYNGSQIQYTVLQNNDIQINIDTAGQFTIQVINCPGYVDGVANTYTRDLLHGSHIAMTAISNKDVEFKLDWNINVIRDLDSHVVIKNSNGVEVAHVFYGNKTFNDSIGTKVVLDIDNVARSGLQPPEIMSITGGLDTYAFYYYVHSFTSTGKIPMTNLNLNLNAVMNNATIDPPFTVPADVTPDRYWNVCKIQNGTIIRASDVLPSVITSSPNTTY